MEGGLKKIELAPWASNFNPATATWVDIPVADTVEDNIQHPSTAEMTVNDGSGTAKQTGKRNNAAIPISNLGAAYLGTLNNNQRYVLRETFQGGVLTMGATNGAILRKLDPSGANLGGLGVVLLQLQTAGGSTGAGVTYAASV